MDIRTVLNIPAWEEFQDELAKLTGAALVCVDLRGFPVTKYSGCGDFCAALKKDDLMAERCQRCAALAGLEAARLDKPCICKCHCGLVEAAVPIMVDEAYLGSVLFGQIRLPQQDSNSVQRLVNEVSPVALDKSDPLAAAFAALPTMDRTRIREYVSLISSAVKYAVACGANLHSGKSTESSAALSIAEEKLRESVPTDSVIQRSSPLYPAVLYVHEHLRESITMNEMAKLCHLSPSYFSRLFSREAGESFVTYVNRHKVELAKVMLRDSNKSISQISSDIGFHDTSHFISLFKRFEGKTPTVYRQHNCR